MASNTPTAAATLGAADGEDGTAARGARKRKTVDFFDPVANNESGKKVAGTPAAKEVLLSNHGTLPPVAITSCIEAQGMGIKLGDIPNVAHRLTKIPGSDEFLEQLHLVLYKRRGTASSRKKDTRAFSGWTFAGDSKEELGRIEERLGKWKLPDVHRAMDLVDLPRGSGDKAAKVRALVEFLEKPKQLSSRDVAATEAKKKGSKAAGKAEGSSAKKRAAVRKVPALLRQARTKAEAEEEEDEEDEDEEEEGPEAAAPKTSKRKAPAAKPKAAAAKKAKTAKPDNGEEDLASLHAAAELLDDMLKAAVRRILSGVDVQNFNIAMLMAQLEKEFGVDVSARKPVIKAIALAYCQEQGEATAAAGEAGAAEADDGTANAASKAEPADAAAAAEDGSGAAAAEPAAPPAAVDAAAAAAEPAAPPAAADAAAAAADGDAAPGGGPADSAVPAGGPAEEPAKDPTLPSSGPPVPEGTAADPAQAAEPTAAPAAAAAAERAEALGGAAPGPAAEADAAPGSEAGPHAAA